MRLSAMVLIASSVLSASLSAASAASLSREQMSRRILDTCVYRQFQVKDVDRSRMIDRCRCATDAAMKALTGEAFELARSGGLTPDQDQAIRNGIAACFK